MLEHGGRLRRAAQRYGIPLGDWLDLSTGVSPHSWMDDRQPGLARSAWTRLPEDDDELADAARDYYGTDGLPVAGSQAAIQALPRLRAPSRVGVIAPGYNEHAHGWRRAGHEVVAISPQRCAAVTHELDVLVLIHPNNPSGACFKRTELLRWHGELTCRNGWLIVDEAFIDATPEQSLAAESARPGLIVLRSLGKFFGLAGIRVGCVLGDRKTRTALTELLGPWTIPGASRRIAGLALQDRSWQESQRLRLNIASERLDALLRDNGLPPEGGCALFQWVCTPYAAALYEELASKGILTRLFDAPSSLRFGLPRTEADWERLQVALRERQAFS